MALRRTDRLDVDDFPQQLADLIGFFTGMAAEDPLARIRAVPGYGDVPEFWLLGSSGYSAQVAGALGVSFAFAHHFASDNTEAALALYRDSFRPSRFRTEPNALIGVQVVTDEDPAVIEEQSAPGMISFIRMRQGAKPEPVSMDEARAYEFSDLERRFIAARTERQAYGSRDEVATKINALVESTGADGVIVSPGRRRRATGTRRSTWSRRCTPRGGWCGRAPRSSCRPAPGTRAAGRGPHAVVTSGDSTR